MRNAISMHLHTVHSLSSIFHLFSSSLVIQSPQVKIRSDICIPRMNSCLFIYRQLCEVPLCKMCYAIRGLVPQQMPMDQRYGELAVAIRIRWIHGFLPVTVAGAQRHFKEAVSQVSRRLTVAIQWRSNPQNVINRIPFLAKTHRNSTKPAKLGIRDSDTEIYHIYQRRMQLGFEFRRFR